MDIIISKLKEELLLNDIVNIHNENFLEKGGYDSFFQMFENDSYHFFIAHTVMNEVKFILGYIIYFDTIDSYDLFEIAVKKEYQNMKIGQLLLIDSQKKIENKPIILEVNENNEKAIKLYKKNGYEEIYIRKNYYSKGENAKIMKKNC